MNQSQPSRWPSHIDSDYLENFFFDAMLNGYASGEKGVPVAEMSGYRRIEFTQTLGSDVYRLTDTWMAAEAPRGTSYGETIIWWNGYPRWHMCYGGSVPKSAQPIVREALRQAYVAKHFFGGRGLRHLEADGLVYSNDPDTLSGWDTFGGFSGGEVVTKRQVKVGYHRYFGGLID